ncbi:MAG: hypothetical protein CL843_06225 [Crocinitomicaceae bacterium]|nr:hypothetical protein [Crocinitomicaceae bacterium]|tara:strand:+ start:3138 stop:4310 length:1173 start_codon:yes stop_codon:yes gene_type:complete
MKRQNWVLLVVFLCWGISVHSQEESELEIIADSVTHYIKHLKNDLVIAVNPQYGWFIPNDDKDANLLIDDAYYAAVDIRVGWQTERGSVYGQLYNFPIYGIGFYQAYFGNRNIGAPNAVYGFLDIPLKRWKQFTWRAHMAFGLSYNFEPYDQENNPLNYMVGSYRNAYINLGSYADYGLTDRLTLGLGVDLKHFSNGSSRQPNFGINLISILGTARYRFNPEKPDLQSLKIPAFKKRSEVYLLLGPGIKQFKANGAIYLNTTAGIRLMRQFNYRHRIGGGLDGFYLGNAFANEEEKHHFFEYVTYGIAGDYELVYRNLSLNLALGVYLFRNETAGQSAFYYERLGIRYRFLDHLITGISVKVHGAEAEYIEWWVGYAFNRKKDRVFWEKR